jgi:hypothetical protein
MVKDITPTSKHLRRLHQVLFCLNLSSAFAVPATDSLVLIAVRHIELAAHGGGEGSLSLLDRILLAINQSLYHWPARTLGSLTADILLTNLMLVFFGLLLLTLRLIAKTGAIDIVLNQMAGIAALAAVPVVWLLYSPTRGVYLLENPSWYAVVLEFAIIGGALYLARKKPNPAWFVVLVVHYSAWGSVLLPRAWGPLAWERSGSPLGYYWAIIAYVVSICAGFIWAFYTMRLQASVGQTS